jgi:hypothetical protein
MKSLTMLFFLIFAALLLKGQARDYRIDIIRKRVQEIKATKGLTVKVLKDEEFLEHTPDGGAELKARSSTQEQVR